MREGHDSELAKGSLDQIFAAFRTVRPHSVMSNGFYDDAVRQLNTALNARLGTQAVPSLRLTIRLAASIGRRPMRTVVSGGGRGNGKGGGHNSTSEARPLVRAER